MQNVTFLWDTHYENPLAPAFTMSEGCKCQVTWNYIRTLMKRFEIPFKQYVRRTALNMCVIHKNCIT